MPDSTPILPLTLAATSAGLLSAAALFAYSIFAPRCQFWAPVIRSIPDRSTVALTFDDGPHPIFTPQILDHLAAHQAQATFFIIGRFAQQHPDLIKRIHNEGHTLGNHSLDHDPFRINRTRAYWQSQIADTQKIIADITGQPPLLFRSPMGYKTWHIAAAARELRLPIIGWSLRASDTSVLPAEKFAAKVLARITGHDILLLHDGLDPVRSTQSQQHTADALPVILTGIAEKKLQILPLIDALLTSSRLIAQGAA